MIGSTWLSMQTHSPWHSPRGFSPAWMSSSSMRVCRQVQSQASASAPGLPSYGQKLNIPSGHAPSAPEGHTRVYPALHGSSSFSFTTENTKLRLIWEGCFHYVHTLLVKYKTKMIYGRSNYFLCYRSSDGSQIAPPESV